MPAGQVALLRIIDVVLVHAIVLIEEGLIDEVSETAPGRYDLKNHLGRDVVLQPLQVTTPVAFWPPEDHQHIRSGVNLRRALYWVPEEIPCNEDLRMVPEHDVQVPLDESQVVVLD